MTTRALAWLAALACSACARDIRLGSAAPDARADAAPDAIASPFTAGSYMVSFLDPAQTNCTGSLAGHDSDFAAITRASSSLVDGAVDFSLAVDQLMIAGAPIQSGFPQHSVTLVPDAASTPPTLWDSGTTGRFDSGPDTTTVTWIGLAVDSASASSPSGVEGAYGRVFETADSTGQCTISFGAMFVRN